MAVLSGRLRRFTLLLFTPWWLGACQNPTHTAPKTEDPVLTAVGYAYLDNQPGPSDAERRLQAMNASRLLAYRQLAEQLYGIGLMPTDAEQYWQSNSRGTVVGARLVRQELEGGLVVTELKLGKADFELLTQLPPPDLTPKWWE